MFRIYTKHYLYNSSYFLFQVCMQFTLPSYNSELQERSIKLFYSAITKDEIQAINIW